MAWAFSPANLTEQRHSDHSNSPVRIIITTLLLLLLIFPIIPEAEEGQPRRGKKGELEHTTARLASGNIFHLLLFVKIKPSWGRGRWACYATVRFTPEIKIDFVNRALNLHPSRDKLRVVCLFLFSVSFFFF